MIIKKSVHHSFIFPLAIVLLGCMVAYGTTAYTYKPIVGGVKNALFKDTIIIIRSNTISLQKMNDSSDQMILEGDVVAKQGSTIFKADKAIKDNRLNTFEAWGNVHINDSDTTHIYSDHLKYFGNTQMAHLDGKVKLTDGQVILTTPSLQYDMTTNIGIYNKGGKVVNGKTIITSKEGEYFRDIQDVFFKKNVVVTDPAYDIKTDSLKYNTGTRTATFITQTHIRDSADRTIDTKEGFYNLQTNQAEFRQRPFINDANKSTLNADVVYLDDNIAKAEGNAIAVDSTRGTIIIANLIFQNRLNEAILATQKPVMIIKQDNDSIYVAADTLFSAKLTDLFEDPIPTSQDSIASLNNNMEGNAFVIENSNSDSTILEEGEKVNVLAHAKEDSTMKPSVDLENVVIENNETIATTMVPAEDSTLAVIGEPDSLKEGAVELPSAIADVKQQRLPEAKKRDAATISTTFEKNTLTSSDSTDRYFEAFHNVRIYSDSMQAISDSLFYSFKDSVFRLYKDPVVWGKESQITGDTILLHTKNKQPSWMEAFKNGFMVNYVGHEAYNQIKASRIDAYFVEGTLDSVRAKGSAETIYYIQDDDSAFTGINHATCDIVDSYFANKQLNKVAFRGKVNGTIYPIKQKKPGEMKLEGFTWREALRPKTKYELFE